MKTKLDPGHEDTALLDGGHGRTLGTTVRQSAIPHQG